MLLLLSLAFQTISEPLVNRESFSYNQKKLPCHPAKFHLTEKDSNECLNTLMKVDATQYLFAK